VFPAFIKAAMANATVRTMVEAGVPLVLSLDNAAVHKKAVGGADGKAWLDRMAQEHGLKGGLQVNWPPAYSPEFHKPIEHSHANTCREFRKQVADYMMSPGADLGTWDIKRFCKVVREAFFKANTRDSVTRDFASLEDTFRQAVKHAGGYVPAKFA
jgi:hypothetical protein